LRQADLDHQQEEAQGKRHRELLAELREVLDLDLGALELVDLGVDLAEALCVRGTEVAPAGQLGDLLQRRLVDAMSTRMFA
jgi:hypothetical protein